MHAHVLPWGNYLALLIPPSTATLVAALWPQGGRRATMAAVVLSVLLLVPALILGLAIVCNHPGACP